MVGVERRVADQQPGIVTARHRRQVGAVRHELRRDAEAVAAQHRISVTDVRELVSSAIDRICSTGTRVKSATDAIGPREPMPTPGTNR